MPSFRDALDDEIERLRAERENALRRKEELVKRIDGHVALVDERLLLATRLADAYARNYAKPVFQEGAPTGQPVMVAEARGPTVPSDGDLTKTPPPSDQRDAGWQLTRADIEATKLPTLVNGHRLYENSKKAQIIRAVIALLRAEGWVARFEILKFLERLGIMNDDEKSATRLSVILSQSRDLFGVYRPDGISVSGWYLIENDKEDEERGTR